MNESNFEKIAYGGSQKKAKVFKFVLKNLTIAKEIVTANPRLWSKQNPRYKHFKKGQLALTSM